MNYCGGVLQRPYTSDLKMSQSFFIEHSKFQFYVCLELAAGVVHAVCVALGSSYAGVVEARLAVQGEFIKRAQ